MSAFEIEILSSAGVVQGFGSITTAQSWDDESRLDAAGAVSFDMPRSDPKSDLIAERMTVRCSTLRGGQWTIIGSGQVEDLTEDVSPDQVPLLDVGASDQLIALADRTVGNLTLSSGTGGKDPMAAASLLPAIATFAPAGWTFAGTPSDSTYLAFAGESVLAALGKLAQQLGDHFRLDSGPTVTWLPKTTAPVASGIRAMSHIPNPQAISTDTCLITRWQRKRDASKQASRVYAYGGGNNDARVTLSGATYTLPAGYSYGTDSVGAYIKNDAADALTRIDAMQTFQDVAALSTATGHAASATNALAQTAVAWLSRHVDVYYSYDVEVTAVSQAILPGQTIRVVIDEYLQGRRIAVVDADLLVLGVKKRLDAEGTPRVVSLTVANSDRWPEDDDHMVAGNAIRAQSQSAHLQPVVRALTADTAAAATLNPAIKQTLTPTLTVAGDAALLVDPVTGAAGTQYGARINGDGSGTTTYTPLGIGPASVTNIAHSLWIRNLANLPGLCVGFASGTLAPVWGAIFNGWLGILQSSPNSPLHVAGSIATAYAAKTGAYTLTATDSVISCSASGGAFNVTLPTAVGITGRTYTIKKTDSSANAVTVNTTSSQTIDAGTTYALSTQWSAVTLVSNGANWLITGKV